MGTADELAMDVLINALSTLSKECVCQLVLYGKAPESRHFALIMTTSSCAGMSA